MTFLPYDMFLEVVLYPFNLVIHAISPLLKAAV